MWTGKKGADYLQRNAYLFERVIKWVDSVKAVDNCTEPNVVLGQSMGGVISRWALRDMENRSITHDTRLFISWDAPMQGANVPLAYQHAARHSNSLLIHTSIPFLLGGSSTIRMVKNALNLMDEPAAEEMLYNRALDNGQLDNTIHDTWQLELKNMGYPQQCRSIAVSNGSECAFDQGFQPGATLLNIVGKGNTRILTDLIGSFTGLGLGFWGGLSLITLKPQFLLGIIPGRNTFSFDVKCYAQPDGLVQPIYKGKITYTKKILWLVNVNTTITDRTRNSNASVLAIDGTPGGMFDTELNLQSSSFQDWKVKYSITASNIPEFNFVPTVSSLDIGSGNATLTLNDYKASYSIANPPATPLNSPFANFVTAYNQVTMSNGQVNNNENHIQISTRNGNFVAMELNGSTGTACLALCTNNLSISGDNSFCTTSNPYTIPNLSSGAIVTWSATPLGVVTINSPNSQQTTLTKTSDNAITLTATISNACGGSNIVITKQVQVGYLRIVNVTYPSSTVAPNELIPVQIFIAPNGLADGYHKLVITRRGGGYSNTVYTFAPGAAEFSLPMTGTYNVKIYSYNDCGWSTNFYPLVFICSNNMFMLSPNPANTSLTVELSDEGTPSSNEKRADFGIKEIQLTDKMGNVLKRLVYSTGTKKITLDVSMLKADIYYLKVFNGKVWMGKSFVKQ